jgi:hypothetical protein
MAVRKSYQVRDPTPSSFKHKIGVCVHCGKPAAKEALFKGDGITVIEKYCGDCLETEMFGLIMTFYDRI